MFYVQIGVFIKLNTVGGLYGTVGVDLEGTYTSR